MMDGFCDDCRFFELVEDRPASDIRWGLCRRHAPRPRSADESDREASAEWARVGWLDWCGEFSPKNPEGTP